MEWTMLSLRQLQAFQAVVETGSFSAAAEALGTTQSAISKRIAELETSLRATLFDREGRLPRLTRQGIALRPLGAEVLRLCDRIPRSLDDVSAYAGALRIGITELVALTFLPTLVAGVSRRLPQAQLRAEVNMAEELHEDLLAGRLDVVIAPGRPPAGLQRWRIAAVEIAWMCSAAREDVPSRLSIAELAGFPLLAQTQRSGLQAAVNEWLAENGVAPRLTLSCNSLSALSGLTVAGFGLSLLPRTYFQPRIDAGELRVIATTPAIPPLEYFASHAEPGFGALAEILVEEAIAAARQSPCWL
jgi:DNA-binding transcriptional LysR family regulator